MLMRECTCKVIAISQKTRSLHLVFFKVTCTAEVYIIICDIFTLYISSLSCSAFELTLLTICKKCNYFFIYVFEQTKIPPISSKLTQK